jgi:hypothetical protein
MKKTKILYWIFTGLFAAAMLSTCIPSEEGAAFITGQLGFPAYFVSYIAIAKVLGVIGILVPGFATIKEWSYAGLFFDLISVTYAFFSINAIAQGAMFLVVFFALGITSYFFYRKKLRETELAVIK